MSIALKGKLMALTRNELIERFGGHGVRPSELRSMDKASMVDYIIEVFGSEFPPAPLSAAESNAKVVEAAKLTEAMFAKMMDMIKQL